MHLLGRIVNVCSRFNRPNSDCLTAANMPDSKLLFPKPRSPTNPPADAREAIDSSTSGILPLLNFQSPVELLTLVCSIEQTLIIPAVPADRTVAVWHLLFSTMAMEMRDLFRMAAELRSLSERDELEKNHIGVFYRWFETFFSMLLCIFNIEDDVLYSWLEHTVSVKLHPSIAANRRRAKKDKAKQLCWDVLQIKNHFGKCSPQETFQEVFDEIPQLAVRVLVYFQQLMVQIPAMLLEHVSLEERKTMYQTLLTTFHSSEQGKFVLAGIARAILDKDQREDFVARSFRSTSPRNNPSRNLRRFKKKHTDLCDCLASVAMNVQCRHVAEQGGATC